MSRRIIGYSLILIALVVLVFVAYHDSVKTHVPIVFSDKDMLNSLWHSYTQEYIEGTSSRTIDKQQGNITTSEGESYSMLRAVWQGDKTTFDASWKWTQDNLQRPSDHLFSWLFGQEPNGTYGILTAKGGQNTASDADSDIALSLVFAYHRWGDSQYLTDAKAVISGIWTQDVVTVKGTPYLAADNLEKDSANAAVIDVSYLAPYSYRIFAQVDPAHPWMKLVDSSYALINETLDSNLGATSTASLPPDWIQISKTTGAISPAAASSTQNTDYSYDALRTPWRLAVDWEWNADPRAKSTLDKMSFLSKEWQKNGALYVDYAHDGSVVSKTEAPAMYGGSIGYFIVSDPSDAPNVYQNKLQYLFDPDTGAWKSDLGYYDSNWAWFGIALYTHSITNLAATSTSSGEAKTNL